MAKKELLLAWLLFTVIAVVFFYKTFFQGLVPFPGDVLVSSYKPWQAYSYLGYSPGTYPSKLQYFDVIRQIYPWKTFSIEELKTGLLPLWNPYNFSGHPLLANFQSAVFYPLNLIYLILPQVFSWTILVFAQPLLAGFFTYLFVRKLGLAKLQAVFTSIAFSYSLFTTVFLEYSIIMSTILWLPASLYFFERILERRTLYNISFFILTILFSFFAGHIQVFTFGLLFLIAYIIYRSKIRIWIFTLLILIIGICSVQLFPGLELISLSARVSHDYKFLIEKLLLQREQLILFLSPDFFGNPATANYLLTDSYPGNAVYIGFIPFIFSIFALKLWKDKLVKFFIFTTLALLLAFLRTPISEVFYSVPISFFSTGSPVNAIFLLSFSLSILSGFGINEWIKRKDKNSFIMVGGLSLLFALSWFTILIFHPEVRPRNFIYSTGLLVLFISIFITGVFFSRKRNILAAIFILVTIFDLFYFFQKFNPFVPKELVFPGAEILNVLKSETGINRFWGYGTASIDANFATQYKLFSPDGYDPLYPARYGEFIQSSSDGKVKEKFTSQTRSDAVIAHGFGEEDLSSNIYRLRVLDVLGVKYILDRTENNSTEKTFPQNRFKLIYEDSNNWRIFENLEAIPRIFLASSYKIFNNKDQFEDIFFSDDFDPEKTILLEEELPHRLNGTHLGKAQVELYEPNKVVIRTATDGRRLLFLSDTYYPGWKAYIDGNETKIYRANYAFRSILVPAGNHTVVFEYKPKSFEIGLKTTIISIVATIIYLFILWKRRYIIFY